MGSRAEVAAAALAVVEGAGGGESGTLLISGEAGVGKTTLVRLACDAAGGAVLWAPCLPLTSLSVPLLPLRTAVRGLAVRPELDSSEALLVFDTWLDRAAGDEPVVLVVDDLQWADQSSLDVLMYVIAGRRDRRLAVLVTIRTGEDGRLRRWLADVRRLPGVREMALDRLDRVSTGEQIGGLLGRPPHESLVDDVFARSAGNPYLTKLLVRGLDPDARSLPPHLPDELRGALSRTWHSLSPPAREVTTAIAVAGRPTAAAAPGEVLREALDAGVLTVDDYGRYWFAHPLLAEVLVEGLLPEERRSRHAALAESADDPIERADHYYRAGMDDEAYRWALKATAVTGPRGAAETVRLLRRALRLRPEGAEESAEDLLHLIRRAAHVAGRLTDEVAAIDDLLALVDQDAQPMVAAELLACRIPLAFSAGKGNTSLEDAAKAERLSSAHPRSREHALAVGAVAFSRLWREVADGPVKAAEALRLARAGGWPDALMLALSATSQARCGAGDLAGGAEAARELLALALRLGEFEWAVDATYWVLNNSAGATAQALVDDARACRQELERAGAVHSHVSEICSLEAEYLLVVGDWRGCLDRLRVALGARPSVLADARGRNTAAILSCRQGRFTEAEAHAARAGELIAGAADFSPFPFDAVNAELAVSRGDTERALACSFHGLALHPPPLDAERLLPLAARALADRVQADRDQGEDPSAELERMRDLRQRYPRVAVVEPNLSKFNARWLAAMQCWADAETARARRDPAELTCWHAAAEACDEAVLPWDEAYCRWREAQAALRGRAGRRQGTTALRRAHELATDLQAAPLLADVDLLARNAHITFEAVVVDSAGDAIPGLTPREREVLVHLVSGRTYSEIARALVLSEKTVGVHVSNMLRKTGTTGRAELAELARRRS
ncbi:LuxR C-terminal-related transcriptional regulator [Actinoplanes sp. Pm04-4]|uniref:LuxR C-terminal-related transcriptional regulator n=1 Tax=Paractinoplanes pyxinae TaxID=2997416 RepID=A0ABT4BIY1_9ACTN|nr:LuxR C-terminal-related transcriptional regulator [Actinoplanes pyxinae]MCY1145558.1 LuxR C-terminal-related transcriptional regulator [Actinoplanes pyxinae]